jgi:hypothetical protein
VDRFDATALAVLLFAGVAVGLALTGSAAVGAALGAVVAMAVMVVHDRRPDTDRW